MAPNDFFFPQFTPPPRSRSYPPIPGQASMAPDQRGPFDRMWDAYNSFVGKQRATTGSIPADFLGMLPAPQTDIAPYMRMPAEEGMIKWAQDNVAHPAQAFATDPMGMLQTLSREHPTTMLPVLGAAAKPFLQSWWKNPTRVGGVAVSPSPYQSTVGRAKRLLNAKTDVEAQANLADLGKLFAMVPGPIKNRSNTLRFMDHYLNGDGTPLKFTPGVATRAQIANMMERGSEHPSYYGATPEQLAEMQVYGPEDWTTHYGVEERRFTGADYAAAHVVEGANRFGFPSPKELTHTFGQRSDNNSLGTFSFDPTTGRAYDYYDFFGNTRDRMRPEPPGNIAKRWNRAVHGTEDSEGGILGVIRKLRAGKGDVSVDFNVDEILTRNGKPFHVYSDPIDPARAALLAEQNATLPSRITQPIATAIGKIPIASVRDPLLQRLIQMQSRHGDLITFLADHRR